MTLTRIFHWLGSALELGAFYLTEVLRSNLRVAYDVLTPAHHMNPAIVTLDVRGLTDRQLLATTHLITMTPGTLSLTVSDDREELSIHAMYVDDAERVVRDLSNNYLRRICNVF